MIAQLKKHQGGPQCKVFWEHRGENILREAQPLPPNQTDMGSPLHVFSLYPLPFFLSHNLKTVME